jgi:hypothetical protein
MYKEKEILARIKYNEFDCTNEDKTRSMPMNAR